MNVPPTSDHANRAEHWFGQFWKMLGRIAAILFLGYFLYRVRSILTDVLWAAIIAFALIGPVNALCRRRVAWMGIRWQRLFATLFVFIAVAAVMVCATLITFLPFRLEAIRLTRNLPRYTHTIQGWASSARAWYATLPPDLRGVLQKQDTSGLSATPVAWLNGLLVGTLDSVKHIVDVILIPVLAFYFVLDGRALRNEFLVLLPRARVRETLGLLRESAAIMQTYIIGQIWLCIIAGVVVYIGLQGIGMDYALILGLLAGVTRAIPIIGPVLGGIPIVLLAAIKSPLIALDVLIFFSLLHFIESKFIMPKFIGHRIHLHAVIVIIVLLIGGEFFGLLGMFLAAPIAAIGRILIGHYLVAPRRRAEAARRAAKPPYLIQA